MKYMTAGLLARYQSEDEGTARQAYEEWEQAGELYRAELQDMRPRLPAEAVELLERYCLHDARVLFAAADAGALVFVLLLDGDGGGLQLEYDLTEPAALTPPPEIAEDCPLEWLYDEFGVPDAAGKATFFHSILFTDGSELRLTCRALRWRHFAKAMFVGNAASPEAATSRRLAELLAA